MKKDDIVNYLIKRVSIFDGGEPYSKILRRFYKIKYGIVIGYGSYGGCYNARNIPSGTIFGNYCSIAEGVKVFSANHPLNDFTTHPIIYNPVMGGVDSDKLYRKKINIGHDVWIGAGSIILPSVDFIGNGAVIGAGSIVTKNVEPYSIVAGNPAKKIRKRFDNDLVELIEATKWWELSKCELIQYMNELSQLVKKYNE